MAHAHEKKRRRKVVTERVSAELRANPLVQLPMSEAQFHALLDHLDTWLGDNGCDRTLVETLSWADHIGLNANQLKALLPELGGGCDCEVLANLDPDDWLGSEPARFTLSSATDADR